MTFEEALKLVNAFERERRDACRLARLVSLAVRVEVGLLRLVRLKLLRGVDAGAEADLWFSPLVQARSPKAVVFIPEVAEVLRGQLARQQELLDEAWRLLKSFHRAAPWALRLEEEITWLALSTRAAPETIEERLLHVLEEMEKPEQRAGLARWAARALKVMPERARTTAAAVELSVVAGEEVGSGPILTTMPRTGEVRQRLGRVGLKELEPAQVGVRLLKNDAAWAAPSSESEAGDERPGGGESSSVQPYFLELSYPPLYGSDEIEVPKTTPIRLDVTLDGGEPVSHVALFSNQTRRVPVGFGEIGIRTALGDLHVLNLWYEDDLLLIAHPTDQALVAQLGSRLRREFWQERQLKITEVYAPLPGAHGGPTPEESESAARAYRHFFRSCRKVGFLISPQSVAETINTLDSVPRERPEPPGARNWLIPIYARTADLPAALLEQVQIDFRRADRFENSVRRLLAAIKDEPLPPVEAEASAPAAQRPARPVEVYCIYARADEEMQRRLTVHLAPLVREGLASLWSDDVIKPGEDWRSGLEERLESADIILMLVSPDFLASDYAYDVEMKRALERHERGEARVIPVVLRHTDWAPGILSKLQILPSGGRPVSQWEKPNEAYVDIAKGVRAAAEEIIRGRARKEDAKDVSPFIPRPPAAGFVTRRDRQGRDLVERLKSELSSQGGQVVTLWGAGGVGKTTLAAEAARALTSVYGRRVVWASADGRPDFSLNALLNEVAVQLGSPDVRTLPADAKQESVRELIANEPTLIVLDDLETIGEEERRSCEQFLASVRSPALVITRARTGGERAVVLDTMSEGEALELLNRLINQTHASHIFTEEVRERIFRVAQGHPLAIELVVRQVAAARNPAIVLDELAEGRGDAAERVFARSFDLPQLGEDGRGVLLALSLFVPSASREALAEVAGIGDDAARLDAAVGQLAALALVRTTADNSRLLLAGLVRNLVLSRLSSDPRAEEFRRRFVKYFVSYVEPRREATPENLDALEAEKENALHAMSLGEEAHDPWSVIQIRFSMDSFLELRGYWDEAITRGEQAAEAAGAIGEHAAEAGLVTSVGHLLAARGELQKARQYLERSVELARRSGDQQSVVTSLHNLGMVSQQQGELEHALSLYEESLEMTRMIGDQRSEASILQNLGMVAQAMGDFDRALEYSRRSLDIFVNLGEQVGVAGALFNLGNLTLSTQDHKEARRLYQESLEIAKKLGNQAGIADTVRQLGVLAVREGDRLEAARLWREALAIYEKLQHPGANLIRQALNNLEGEVS